MNYVTDDGSGKKPNGVIKLQIAKSTPRGPAIKKSKGKMTPLSPSTTDELESGDINYSAAPQSTDYDEMLAWLLQNKIDDDSIGNYLVRREISLSDLSEFDENYLEEIIKNIEEKAGTTIEAIDKHRFIKACKALRPPQPISPRQQYHQQQGQPPMYHSAQSVPYGQLQQMQQYNAYGQQQQQPPVKQSQTVPFSYQPSPANPPIMNNGVVHRGLFIFVSHMQRVQGCVVYIFQVLTMTDNYHRRHPTATTTVHIILICINRNRTTICIVTNNNGNRQMICDILRYLDSLRNLTWSQSIHNMQMTDTSTTPTTINNNDRTLQRTQTIISDHRL